MGGKGGGEGDTPWPPAAPAGPTTNEPPNGACNGMQQRAATCNTVANLSHIHLTN